jgi:hypothetical protein
MESAFHCVTYRRAQCGVDAKQDEGRASRDNKERKKRKTFDLKDVPCPLVFDQALILMGVKVVCFDRLCFCPILLSLPEGHSALNLIRVLHIGCYHYH